MTPKTKPKPPQPVDARTANHEELFTAFMEREDRTAVLALLDNKFQRQGLADLRPDFPEDVIGKLPRWDKKKQAEIFLDYVGHATVTQRLLDIDLFWNWKPMLTMENGSIVFDVVDGHRVGLWIELTVLDVTRLGYGAVGPGTYDEVKQLIGDAIRNAAMRFGVALSLWEKHREEEDTKDTETRDAGPAEELMCQFCGEVSNSRDVKVIPSGFEDNPKTGINKGDLVFHCPGCGAWPLKKLVEKSNTPPVTMDTPATVATLSTPPAVPMKGKEFAPGHEMKRVKGGVLCDCGLEFEETPEAKSHWEKTLAAHLAEAETRKAEAEKTRKAETEEADKKQNGEEHADPGDGDQGDMGLDPPDDDDLPF